MGFPPIVGRELRVTARRGSFYWIRVVVAACALGIGCAIFLAEVGAPQRLLGQQIFYGLSCLLMFYCLAAGRRWTVDCLSEEKRDGTLGLLFLTDLKGYDVVLGKLAATSLGGLYGLLAVLPVLALPLLLGGVSNGEFGRMVLVLLNAFLLSLAVGIFCSALSTELRRAAAANFLLLLVLGLGFPTIGVVMAFLYSTPAPIQSFFLPCPFFSFYLAFDTQYRSDTADYWWSAGTIFTLSLSFVAAASWIAPRSWQDRPIPAEKSRGRGFWHAWSYGSANRQAPFRKQLLDRNPFYWLAARARLKPLHVWLFVGAMAVWWLWVGFSSGSYIFEDAVFLPMALILNSALKLWIALEAGQRLAEDQRAGALELLLSTPLTVTEIVRGQFLALRRQFLAPLLIVIAMELVLMLGFGRHSTHYLAFAIACTFVCITDILALSVVAMRIALTSRGPNQTVLATIACILVLPWVLQGAAALAINVWEAFVPGSPWMPGGNFYFGLWFVLGLATDLVFGLIALRQLLRHFRELATRRFAPVSGQGPLRRQSNVRALLRDLSPRLKRSNRATFIIIFVLALVAVAALLPRRSRPASFPPPVVVSVTISNRPPNASNCGQGFFLILPDGSLWRWGAVGCTASGLAAVPERVGTNSDWVEAKAWGAHGVGLRQDGTLWEWGTDPRQFINTNATPGSEPWQADQRHDWATVDMSGFGLCVALRRDGTVWTSVAGTASPDRPVTNRTGLVQVGTNRDWVAASCVGFCAVALRRNGTLWAWGELGSGFIRSLSSRVKVPFPEQVCRETNWTTLDRTVVFYATVWAKSGDMWELSLVTPLDANAAATATGRILVSNSSPGHVALAIHGNVGIENLNLYNIRPDGTLWETAYHWNPSVTQPPDTWHQVGKRSDWTWLWGGGGTALGLTSDGTLWMWGYDVGQTQSTPPTQTLNPLQTAIRTIFNRSSGSPSPTSSRQVQNEPRPLMHFVTTDPNAAASGLPRP